MHGYFFLKRVIYFLQCSYVHNNFEIKKNCGLKSKTKIDASILNDHAQKSAFSARAEEQELYFLVDENFVIDFECNSQKTIQYPQKIEKCMKTIKSFFTL